MELLQSLFTSAIWAFNPVIIIPIVLIIIILVKQFKEYKEYKSSTYYQVTKQSYLSVYCNAGRYGEYLTYKQLKHLEAYGAKFLFNVYIPKGNDETTEIDILMICSKGIFVFESKNYSGWIFGNERQKNWYQTLPAGRGRSHKEHFYNPVMQNRSHINHLRVFLNTQVPLYSVIVFSDRCTLKNIQLKSNDVFVINRCDVAPVVSLIYNQTPSDMLSVNSIAAIYSKLYPCTQIDESTKVQHIANIYDKLNSTPVPQIHPTSPIAPTNEMPEQGPTTKTNADDVKITGSQPLDIDIPAVPVIKCPRCNGTLILRTAIRGANAGNKFYGCSNYPKCKYIQNTTNTKQV